MNHLMNAIQHFIYNDHKAEVTVGIVTAATTGFVSANQMSLAQELMYRDINTAIMTIVGAAIGFFVTMGLKKIFEKK